MMLLISLAILVAFGASGHGARPARPGVLVGAFAVIVIMLLGHWLEMQALGQASVAWTPWRRCCLTRLSEWSPMAKVETVPVTKLAVGDVVLVRSRRPESQRTA